MGTKRPKKAPSKGTARTPPFEAYPAWSEAKFFGFLRSALRSASSKWPPKYEVLLAARRPSESDNKRLKWEFQCAECKQWFPQKEVSVDHITPVGTLRTWEDIEPFVRRLFVGHESLQLLCRRDHDAKTARERTGEKAGTGDDAGVQGIDEGTSKDEAA